MSNLLSMSPESEGDWYEAISLTQPDSVELMEAERDTFNAAFESFTRGYHDIAYRGLLELSNKGSSISQYFLGVMYLGGEGVLQDFCRAHMWLNIASSQGHKSANQQLEKLTKLMSPNQIAEAQKLARKCLKQNYKDC
jgi:TPR repeat protein